MMVKRETSEPLPPEEIIRRIEKALHHGGDTHTWEDVRHGLLDGKFQIFWNEFGACITEVVDAPRCRYLNCFVVAGKLPEVMELHEQVERFALSQSCKYMTTSGRHGWTKVLPGFGWKPSRTVFVKEIEGY
jgi:uncharacterized protein YcnI